MIKRYCFEKDDYGKTLSELGYDQINAVGRFIFDHPIVISPTTLIEHDGRAGTFYSIRSDGQRESISGKWDR